MSTLASESSAGVPAFAAFGDPRLTLAETKQLWWMLDGGIMQAKFRDALRRSWGLCPRHAWAFALAEVELRGGLPFVASVLVEDLLVTGGDSRRLHRLGSERRRLTGNGCCPTCDYTRGGPEVESSWLEAAERASSAERMRALVTAHADRLRRWSCPWCTGGEGLICRPHVVAGAAAPGDLDGELRALAKRVRAYRRATEPDSHDRVDERTAMAWGEGLGWLAGWDFLRVWGSGTQRV